MSDRGYAPNNTEMHGAHCNKYGHMYLRVMTSKKDHEKLVWVDHGISLAEAICIRNQLDEAINYKVLLETKRI